MLSSQHEYYRMGAAVYNHFSFFWRKWIYCWNVFVLNYHTHISQKVVEKQRDFAHFPSLAHLLSNDSNKQNVSIFIPAWLDPVS